LVVVDLWRWMSGFDSIGREVPSFRFDKCVHSIKVLTATCLVISSSRVVSIVSSTSFVAIPDHVSWSFAFTLSNEKRNFEFCDIMMRIDIFMSNGFQFQLIKLLRESLGMSDPIA
jgi:hypothetical protein